MISDPVDASVYTDFQGLARLRAEAGKQTPESIRETARQFEALFVQMMLKSMRDASPDGGLFDSDKLGFYQELYDRQLSLEVVKGRGLGISGMLATQLGAQEAAVPVIPLQQTTAPAPLVAINSQRPVQPLVDINTAVTAPLKGAENDTWQPENPAEFIRDVWPHAVKGAAKLGVQPEVLIAQAALETGWGQKVIRRADGSSSFNLFGIKADPGWSGDRASVATLEYAGDVATRQRATFRAYDSLDAAVMDYADFLQTNPRYGQALEQAADRVAFLHGLKAAGYATDPEYANKIMDIMNMDAFGNDIAAVQNSRQPPIT
ncbi:MAG: flagellar assembly peptidoglycan hydrolase FlgJ [Gammaproteobacteria bacterium]